MSYHLVKRCLLIASLFSVVLVFSGCYRLTFDNGPLPQNEAEHPHREWHHIGIIRLVEFSDPVDLYERCKGKEWTSVETELTFIQGVIAFLPYNYVYHPREVEWACAK
jgi:hypothetical protein